MTSHTSQGQTAERVLIHMDTEQAPGELVNSRMAYVSVSRGQFDVQVPSGNKGRNRTPSYAFPAIRPAVE